MPYARISLLKGKSPQYLRALADGIHQAMVDSIAVPPADRFQLIHQHEAGEMIIDPEYGGGPRSEDFVLVTLHLGRPRTKEAKAALYARMAELLSVSPGLAPADLMVVLIDGEMDSWSFSHGRQASALSRQELQLC
ncbi:tautomerase family protein [Chromobacterium sp. IIBBL 290-4]|uniref:tautomerase family protein n=1 Tax=Chromobacterium sp. IIBBL 290-4 TaxID=2953890 RepID=UPI0020B7DD5B|nr:tautomerase family protein [Chromobacterium sp. IIBBL 290-4]UTH72784.1 tautomerase family protein [Chromobacterium sp. IIBBL 290-4]